ncbi:MAG TPA: hypothetical protein VEJ36_04150 [Nitrososphaerales archaeon]|nr:hypothetical protein [Nitrososphaerales archaeon]
MKPSKYQLSLFELTLLRNLSHSRDDKELSKITNVDRKIVSKALDRLYDRGYVGQKSLVTEQGFDVLNALNYSVRREDRVDLTSLELLLLGRIRPSLKDKELSRWAQVDQDTVSTKLDKLFDDGLITSSHMLTEKGFNILHEESDVVERSPQKEFLQRAKNIDPTPMSTLVIQREIIRVPCRYCGNLNDLATSKTCSQCGAAIK